MASNNTNETMMDIESAIEEALQRHGYLKEVAGQKDWHTVRGATLKILAHQAAGILMLGDSGCGKTCAMTAISKSIKEFMPERRWPSLCRLYLRGAVSNLPIDDETGVIDRDCFLDDLGVEAVKKEYGNKLDPISDFIMAWHNQNEFTNKPTRLLFITTNETVESLGALYGARILDRLTTALFTCRLTSESHRRGLEWRDEPVNATADVSAPAPGYCQFPRDTLFADAVRVLSEKFAANA